MHYYAPPLQYLAAAADLVAAGLSGPGSRKVHCKPGSTEFHHACKVAPAFPGQECLADNPLVLVTHPQRLTMRASQTLVSKGCGGYPKASRYRVQSRYHSGTSHPGARPGSVEYRQVDPVRPFHVATGGDGAPGAPFKGRAREQGDRDGEGVQPGVAGSGSANS